MNFEASIPYFDTIQLQYMKSIDLTDYYINAQDQGFIFCQICKLNIAMQNVFEHSLTKRHKYNKLLFGIVQGLSSNVDMDFIVLHIDSLQCRYCDSVIIKSNREALVIDHIQDVRHCTRRQYYLDQTNPGNLLKPLDTLISYASNIKKEQNPISQTREYLRDINREYSRDYARTKEEEFPKRFSLGVEAGTNIRETNNIRQHRPPQCSAVSSDEKLQSGTGVLSKHVDSGLVHIVEIDDVRACKICRRVISTLPDVHVRTKKHRAMMQKVDERLIGFEEVEKLWVCKICEKIFPKSKEFTHIYSYKHMRKTEALS